MRSEGNRMMNKRKEKEQKQVNSKKNLGRTKENQIKDIEKEKRIEKQTKKK